jgi:uncharacterized repeat protein (TIGR01451 family)
MKRLTKFGIYSLITAVIICKFSLTVSAWGPSNREAFTIDNPPDYVTFNSITDNPQWGDERTVTRIREVGTNEWSYGAELAPGKTFEITAYYHNNSMTSDAEGAFVRAFIPAVVDGEAMGSVFFGAANANPQEIWGSITFTSDRIMELRYVGGSAKLHNFAEAVSGSELRTFDLPIELFRTGTPIGFDALDGIIPGGQFYDGYVSFMVHVPDPRFSFGTEVAKRGAEGQWYSDISEVDAQVGDILRFRMYYMNTGNVNQNDIVVSSVLNDGLAYVDGSTVISTSTANGPHTRPALHNTIVAAGLNLGNFEPGAEAYVLFEAEVTSLPIDAMFSVDTDNSGLDRTMSLEGVEDVAAAINFAITVGLASAFMVLFNKCYIERLLERIKIKKETATTKKAKFKRELALVGTMIGVVAISLFLAVVIHLNFLPFLSTLLSPRA